MGKHVVKWSYWLGVVSAVLALLTRGLDILGVKFLVFPTKGSGIGYHTYLDAALFFLVISIAAAHHFRESQP
ncbi:MAG TPA: hypothetical protein VGT24_07530 [Candidatus Acidoferrales bacterium]|nr:hypothetical protein [Candidatus Acidoferrales bacterium]